MLDTGWALDVGLNVGARGGAVLYTPPPTTAVPREGVGAHCAERPDANFIRPLGCRASGGPGGRVPTKALKL